MERNDFLSLVSLNSNLLSVKATSQSKTLRLMTDPKSLLGWGGGANTA